jgi:hypothetical protein
MKKNYFKPETELVDVTINNILLDSSGDNIPVVPGEGDEFANRHRGEWGNVWGK